MAREMKDSGVEWIDKIPKHWKKFKGKYILKLQNKPTRPTDEVITCFRDGEVTLRKNRREDGFTVSMKEFGYQGIDIGDLVVHGMDGFAGAIGMSDSRGKASPVLNVLETLTKDISKRYLMYELREMAKEGVFLALTSGIRVRSCDTNWSKLSKLEFIIPPLNEQVSITNYLDNKCSEIDSLTSDIEKQISLLEDYKKSIIAETVTKGLDPNVEMKDSSIEWIGDIPKLWTVHPIYCYFSERKIKNFLMKEHNLLSLSYGKIIKKDINALGGLLPASFNTYNIVERDDIIIRPTDLQNDKKSLRTGLVQEKGIITSAYLDLKPNKNVCSKFFHYLLHSYDVIKVFYNMGNGVRQGLTYGVFSSLKVIEPPLSEQQNIANYLDKKCSEIDSLIEEKKEQLEKLASYKQSMIYEYVTGK